MGSSTPISRDAHGYLRDARSQIVLALDGLSDGYQIRRPVTPTGTNLLGVVKHLIGIEAGYLGLSLGMPFPRPLPWLQQDLDASPNADMWATEDESKDYLLELYAAACAHADAVLAEVGMAAPARVPWWSEDQRDTTAEAVLLRVLKDTAMHAGQLQILRELIDGQAGSDRDALGDADWWRAYTEQLETVAQRFG